MKGLVLFGYYPALPSYIRDHGRQASFGGGHAMALLPDGPKPSTPFLSEFTLEFGPITGCTESSAAMIAAWATGIPSISQPTTREVLQSAIGAQNSGVTPAQLQAGILKVLKIPTTLGSSWATISAIGAYAWLGDPLAKDWLRIPVADVKGFCAGKSGIIGPNQTVIFTKTESPDTSTGGSVEISEGYSPPATVSFPAGAYTGYHLDGTRKPGNLASSSAARTSAKVVIDKGLLASGINGTFLYIVDGIWAGYYVPARGLTVTPNAGGITQAQLDAAVSKAATDGFALAKDKAAKAVNGITQ